MNITEDEYNLLKEVAAEFPYPRFDPNKHVTLAQLTEEWGVSRSAARERMRKLENKYEKITVLTEGNRHEAAYQKIG